MKRLKKYLTNTFSLTEEEWSLIQQKVSIKKIKKGEFFLEQGKTCKNSGLILEGLMRYFSYDEKGNDPTCYFSSEYQYILDPFVFQTQLVSDMNLQAVINCEIAVISFDNDKELRSILPKWKIITDQLLLEVTMNFANQKQLLTMNASERYDYFVKNFATVARRAPLQYIASYLGIKQPSLSRIRKNTSR
jgi:hypothetical protein